MHSDEPRNLTFRRRSRIQKRKRRCPHIGQRQRSCTWRQDADSQSCPSRQQRKWKLSRE